MAVGDNLSKASWIAYTVASTSLFYVVFLIAVHLFLSGYDTIDHEEKVLRSVMNQVWKKKKKTDNIEEASSSSEQNTPTEQTQQSQQSQEAQPEQQPQQTNAPLTMPSQSQGATSLLYSFYFYITITFCYFFFSFKINKRHLIRALQMLTISYLVTDV